MKKLFLFSVLLGVSLCPMSLAAPNAIVAGRSIGHIHLREPAEQATQGLGTPNKRDAAMGHFWEVWLSRARHLASPSELDVLTVRDASGLHEYVEQVRITSPWFMTQNGIRVGSRLSTVLAAFPHAQPIPSKAAYPSGAAHSSQQSIALYDDRTDGIAFEFSAATRNISASSPCQAIIILPKRHGVLNEYYPWYYRENGDGALHSAL